MNDLPQELVDRVIDLCDDKEMSVCGLVCRRWARRSRGRLFTALTVHAQSLPHIVDIVDTSSFPILSFVRELTLTVVPALLDDALLARLHPCPNLRTIRITGTERHVGIDPSITTELDALQPHLRSWAVDSSSITRLDLVLSTPKISLQTVMNAVSCLPGLSELHMEGFATHQPSPPPSIRLAPLRALFVRSCDPVFFSWVLTLPSVLLFHHLTVGPFMSPSEKSVELYGMIC
ncbi:hypothetical protein FB45DRAFT_1065910 [Roridomyces roridus]|uniref:F-box domain-containing protein n=1 Tax=Roridomyces roridus TaxID=1738132 RepID=A0AAD7FBZ4_9AGAR|nr:hypothetical protein FB45DRAFT_1065910 [Roridomyces roridus]